MSRLAWRNVSSVRLGLGGVGWTDKQIQWPSIGLMITKRRTLANNLSPLASFLTVTDWLDLLPAEPPPSAPRGSAQRTLKI